MNIIKASDHFVEFKMNQYGLYGPKMFSQTSGVTDKEMAAWESILCPVFVEEVGYDYSAETENGWTTATVSVK